MKKIKMILLGLIVSLGIIVYANGAQNLTKSLTGAKYDNHEVFQGSIEPGTVYNDASISSSTDPFDSKTNKYCESRAVEICALTKGVHLVWGASTVSAATSTDYLILANACKVFNCNPNKPYLRVIEESASSEIFVTELN